jgi:hypothetical protein
MKEGEYFQFCFDHVREYNKGFNYFSGVPDGEVARFQKEAHDRAPADLEDRLQCCGRFQ